MITREGWLRSAIDAMRPDFERVGAPLPGDVHISIGFPSKSALSKKNQRIGECWRHTCSEDGNPHVFITPLIADPVRVLDILVHELIHAAGRYGHGAEFKKPAVALGLTGKMTATVAGPELTERLRALAGRLGVFPHKALRVNPNAPKQSTRLIKAECASCGFVMRTTRKWIEEIGLPTCACGGDFA